MLTLLSVAAASAYGQTNSTLPQTPYLVTKNRIVCLHTYRSGDAVELCRDGEFTTAERLQMKEAIRSRDAKRAELLKPDPRTPRFNSCVDKYHANYYYVSSECRLELAEDVQALHGWLLKGEVAEAAERSGRLRLSIMEAIAQEELGVALAEQTERRLRQTPLQNAIEKAGERCMYADQDHIMRACD
jgi:hypothetical protein